MTVKEFEKVWRPYVTKAVKEIVRRFPGTSNQGTYNGHDPEKSRAVDFMVPLKGKLGDAIANFLANPTVARRLGIWYVIWNERIWSMTPGKTYWKKYYPTQDAIDRNEASARHWNHVHVSFYLSAPGPWYVDANPTPKPKPKTVKYVITANGGLYGLYGPGGKVKIDASKRPKGRKLDISRIVIGPDGRKWAVTPFNTYYSLKYLRKV